MQAHFNEISQNTDLLFLIQCLELSPICIQTVMLTLQLTSIKVCVGSVLRALGEHWNWATHSLALPLFFVSSITHLILYLTGMRQMHNKLNTRMEGEYKSWKFTHQLWWHHRVNNKERNKSHDSVFEMMCHGSAASVYRHLMSDMQTVTKYRSGKSRQ